MNTFLVGCVIGIIAVPVVVFLYFISGRAPTATGDNPLPLEKMLANSALHAHIDREMPQSVPIQANKETFLADAHVMPSIARFGHGFPTWTKVRLRSGCSRSLRNCFAARG